jgi:hypothetical protein
MKNARFNVMGADIDGGPVVLTLRPGESLFWFCGGPHEEGWSRECYTWEYDAEIGAVVHTYSFDGRDCDGRHSYYSTGVCPLDQLHAHENAGTLWPLWEEIDQSRRDYAAEAAGY